MVLTLILLMQRQRKHPHKLSGYIFKERSPEFGADHQVYSAGEAADQPCGQRRIVLEVCRGPPFPQQAAHYTGPGGCVNTFFHFFFVAPKPAPNKARRSRQRCNISRKKRLFSLISRIRGVVHRGGWQTRPGALPRQSRPIPANRRGGPQALSSCLIPGRAPVLVFLLFGQDFQEAIALQLLRDQQVSEAIL